MDPGFRGDDRSEECDYPNPNYNYDIIHLGMVVEQLLTN